MVVISAVSNSIIMFSQLGYRMGNCNSMISKKSRWLDKSKNIQTEYHPKILQNQIIYCTLAPKINPSFHMILKWNILSLIKCKYIEERSVPLKSKLEGHKTLPLVPMIIQLLYGIQEEINLKWNINNIEELSKHWIGALGNGVWLVQQVGQEIELSKSGM